MFTMSQALYLSYIPSSSRQPYEVGSIIHIPIVKGENWGSGRFNNLTDIVQLGYKSTLI